MIMDLSPSLYSLIPVVFAPLAASAYPHPQFAVQVDPAIPSHAVFAPACVNGAKKRIATCPLGEQVTLPVGGMMQVPRRPAVGQEPVSSVPLRARQPACVV